MLTRLLVVFGLGVASIAFLPTMTMSCATQETKSQVDAGQRPCQVGPAIHCEIAPADGPACNTDDPGSTLLQQLPRATRYKQGCVVYLIGNRDEQGDCRREASCSCVFADPELNQPPTPEAGTPTAEDAGDASTAPPDPAPANSAVVWQCYDL